MLVVTRVSPHETACRIHFRSVQRHGRRCPLLLSLRAAWVLSMLWHALIGNCLRYRCRALDPSDEQRIVGPLQDKAGPESSRDFTPSVRLRAANAARPSPELACALEAFGAMLWFRKVEAFRAYGVYMAVECICTTSWAATKVPHRQMEELFLDIKAYQESEFPILRQSQLDGVCLQCMLVKLSHLVSSGNGGCNESSSNASRRKRFGELNCQDHHVQLRR
jgi:hypothetical protein